MSPEQRHNLTECVIALELASKDLGRAQIIKGHAQCKKEGLALRKAWDDYNEMIDRGFYPPESEAIQAGRIKEE